MPLKDPHRRLPYDLERLARLPRVYGDTPSFLGSPLVELPDGARGKDVVFMGVPWEGAVTWGGFSGCELAVKTIRQASVRYGTYLPELDQDAGEALRLGDAGDVAVVPGKGPETMQAVHRTAVQVFQAGARPVFFGGDHSYTPAIIEALVQVSGGPVGVLHLDAHLDNLPDYGGDTLARCGPLYRIARTPGVRPQSVVSFGIRGPRNAPLQMEMAREAGSPVLTMAQVREMGFEAAVEQAIALAHQETKAVYLTICSDILDGLCNPGGAPDFDGLLPHELFYLVRRAAAAGLAGMDYVEVYPLQDPAQRSSHLASWTLIHALAGMAQAKQGAA